MVMERKEVVIMVQLIGLQNNQYFKDKYLLILFFNKRFYKISYYKSKKQDAN